MILYAVLGVLLIAMIVFAVISARKDWHWLNPVLLIFIFIAGSAGMIGMAQTLHKRRTVLKKIETERQRVVRAEEQRQKLVYGDLNSVEYSPDSMRGLAQQVELLQLGRGRVWEGGTVSNEDGEIKFTFPAEQPKVEDENMSLQDVELFAFATDQNQFPFFVGKLRVIEHNTTELFLEQSVPIANFQEFNQPKAATWTLYERMPFDKHGIFRDLYAHLNPNDPLVGADDKFDISKFRQFLTTHPSALPAAKMGLNPESAEYERLIDEIAFDSLKMGEIEAWVDKAPNRVSPRFEPGPTEVFVRYKFTGDSKESYTVDDKTGKLDTDGAFSEQGHAIDPLLHLSPGEESRDVSFRKDDEVEIDQRTVDGYQRPDGTVVPKFTDREPNVQIVDRFYHRKLVDFPYEMTKLYNRGFQAQTEEMRLRSNNEVQDTAIADLLKQQQERTREKVAYENDNQKLQNDNDKINAHLQQLEQRVAERSRQIDVLKSQLEGLRSRIEIQSRAFGATGR